MVDKTHNQCPPHEHHAATIRELDEEAKAWLTGAEIPDTEAAQDLGNFLTRVDDALKAAKSDKETEFRPHKDAADAVTAKYKAMLKMADDILKTGKQLITAWQRKAEEAHRRDVQRIAMEAERVAKEAREALQASDGDLEARQDAERMAGAAKTREIAAKVVAKQAPRVEIGGRKVAMRQVVRVDVVDANRLLKWAYHRHYDRLVEFVTGLALNDAKAGVSEIPGVEIARERKAA